MLGWQSKTYRLLDTFGFNDTESGVRGSFVKLVCDLY